MCNIQFEYEWKPPKCACCKVFGHGQDECPKNIDSGAAKNLKKPSQAPRGVPVGPKIKKLLIDGKVTLVDDEGKPLEKVDSSGDHDSEDEVTSVDKKWQVRLQKKVGYGPDKIQSICDNLDIKVRGCNKK
nr:zinc knuckle CX2CX4HX4C [Tanacetum cinerariifolium]